MKWKKKDEFIEIESASSADLNCSVWIVNTNLSFKKLPVKFRSTVPKTDTKKSKDLIDALSSWAKRNEFKPMASDSVEKKV